MSEPLGYKAGLVLRHGPISVHLALENPLATDRLAISKERCELPGVALNQRVILLLYRLDPEVSVRGGNGLSVRLRFWSKVR